MYYSVKYEMLIHLSKWILTPTLANGGGQSDHHIGDTDFNNSFQQHSNITNGRNIDL